jgi:glycerol-3-phosphate acyltransferase PlsY
MLEAGFKILLAYFLGSVSGSLLLGRLRQVDIRTMGSGNAGGTNALRTQGLPFALGVIIIDVGKGAVAAGWFPHLGQSGSLELVAACGFAAVFGHCYPIWHGFRGGKGAATAVGTLTVISPWLLVTMLSTWVLTLLISGYVGLATVLAGLSLTPAAAWLGEPKTLVIYGLLLGLFMAYTHRSNFRKMLKGTENRSERFRVMNWFRKGKNAVDDDG